MEPIFDEAMIRDELRRLDTKTGLHAADLPIKFGNTKRMLGKFSYHGADDLKFYFSNYYFSNTNFPIEEKLDIIRHEYAHYMDYMLNGSSSHGSEWKRCCSIVGAFPTKYFDKQRSDSFLAKHEKERELSQKYNSYEPGTVIIHPGFGKGRIVGITGEGIRRIALVIFENVGEKKIAISWIDSKCKRE